MRIPTIAACAMLAALPGLARADDSTCLTRQEFSDLASYALPSALSGTAQRCAPILGKSAYLPANGDKLVEAYAARKDKSWPAAKSAFLKINAKSGDKTGKLLTHMPDDALQDMVDLMIEGMVAQGIPPDKCETIDEFARLLAPLPPENTAQIIALIVSLAGKPLKDGSGRSAIGKLAICQDRA
ncbi:MAG: hypothetical protein N2423_00645, partial [Novosphingobium sp.]|nr:hypothetical protein [Novosphingobium sp.]